MGKKSLSSSRRRRNKPTVSLCMIVRNEEACLGRCLDSVCEFVDEIVIVDTGSTDRTCEIASGYGARIYRHPWENDFSKHRNQSLSYATGDWILQLDADEELFVEDGLMLREIARHGNADYYHCQFYDIKSDGSVHGVFYLIRFFRNGMGMSYERKIHNQLRIRGNGSFSTMRIRHYGYDLSREKMDEKHVRTTTLLQEMLEKDPEDVYSRHQLASSYSMHREFDKAVEHGEVALEMLRRRGLRDDFFITTFYTVAQGYHALGNDAAAESICREALEFFPRHLDICHLLAAIYFRQRALDQSLSISRRYLQIYDDFEHDPLLMGSMYCHSYTKRHEIFFGLACIHFMRNEFETADTFFQRSYEDSGKQMEKAESVCRFYFEQHMEDRAVKWLVAAYEAGNAVGHVPDILRDQKTLYLKIAKAYMLEGRLDLAIACLNAVADEFPGTTVSENPTLRSGQGGPELYG